MEIDTIIFTQRNRLYRSQQMQWKTSYPLEARAWDLATVRQRWIHCTTTRPSKKRWNHRVLLLHLWGCRETSVLHARFPHLPLGTRGYSGIVLILTYQGTEANTYTNKQALSPATNAMKNLLPLGGTNLRLSYCFVYWPKKYSKYAYGYYIYQILICKDYRFFSRLKLGSYRFLETYFNGL